MTLEEAREACAYYGKLREDMDVRSWMADDLHDALIAALAAVPAAPEPDSPTAPGSPPS